MAAAIDLTNKRVGKLVVLNIVPKEERPTQNHGNYWLCQCDCGNQVKVPTTYLTGNSNYTQRSCGCDRKIKAFKISSGLKIEDEFLESYQQDFEKYLFIHKALVRTSGNPLSYYQAHLLEYKELINYFYYDNQFNAVYNFWKQHEKESPTFYDYAKPSLDHKIPRSKNGTNTLENFQFITTFENLAKRDMTWKEWCEFKEKTHSNSDYFIENIYKGGQD